MQSSEKSELIRKAIEEKCGEIRSLKMSWERMAAKALDAGVSPETIASLIGLLRSPRNAEQLVSSCGASLGAFLGKLRVLVDESPFELGAWVEAFELVQAHLVREGRAASPESIVGYIHCTADFASGPACDGSLARTVLEMLERYGFEGQEGCSTG